MNKPESDGVIWNHAQLLDISGSHRHYDVSSSMVIIKSESRLKTKLEEWEKWVGNQIKQIDSIGLSELVEEEFTIRGQSWGISIPEIIINVSEDDGVYNFEAESIINFSSYEKDDNECFLRKLLEIDGQFFIDIHLIIDYFSAKFFNKLLESGRVRSITISNGRLPGTVSGGKYTISYKKYYEEEDTKPYYANLELHKKNHLYEDPLAVFDEQLSLLAELSRQEGLVDFKIYDASLTINRNNEGRYDYVFSYNVSYNSKQEFIDTLIPHFSLCEISSSTTPDKNTIGSKSIHLGYIIGGEPDQQICSVLQHKSFILNTAQKYNINLSSFHIYPNDDSSNYLNFTIENIQDDAFINEILSNKTDLNSVQLSVNSDSKSYEEHISLNIPGTTHIDSVVAVFDEKISEFANMTERYLCGEYSIQYKSISFEFDNKTQNVNYYISANISCSEFNTDFLSALIDAFGINHVSLQGKI
ncbi:MAG: hypothetical protein D6B27_07210 [Gammaproteobacteria bacterium]|nr:MAG: hypothetical protein D6B27_07210 [Gammaproteobacteria bacterium]